MGLSYRQFFLSGIIFVSFMFIHEVCIYYVYDINVRLQILYFDA